MRFSLTKTLLLFVLVVFFSCTSEEPAKPQDLANSVTQLPAQTNPGNSPNSATQLPVLTTAIASNVSSTSATSGGTVTSDGGLSITQRGVVWSKNQAPTITDSKTIDGNGTGSFASTISNLTSGTTYYVRAYAINSKGTSYGNQVSFATTTVSSSSLFMSGKFNGVQMNTMKPNIYPRQTLVNYDANNDRFLWLQGNGLNGLQLNIYIPESQWTVGTYDIFDHHHYITPSSNVWLVQNLPTVSRTDIINGTITITEFNLVTKKIKGTFSFQYNNMMKNDGPDEGPYQVTNGTFDYNLDDKYFQ